MSVEDVEATGGRATRDDAQPPRAPSAPRPMGRFPGKGRQSAYDSYVSASLCVRQTPELFGGVSTD